MQHLRDKLRKKATIACPMLTALFALTMCCTAVAGDAQADGFRPLFNGQDLTGWRGKNGAPGKGWRVEDGQLVRTERGGDIYTEESFGDFVLELEFITRGNSGLLFRKPDPSNTLKDRLEIQIMPPRSGKPSKHSCGSLYDCVAPSKEMSKEDDWNHLRLTSANRRVEVVLNGEKIIDVDLTDWTETGRSPDGKPNKFIRPLKEINSQRGHIGFQDHGAEVRYRNIRIRSLDDGPVEAPKAD